MIDRRIRRLAGRKSLGIAVLVGAGAATLAALNPAAAQSMLAQAGTVVNCATSSACILGNNTSSGPGVAGTSAKGPGVQGKSTSNIAIKAISTSNYGILGTTTSGSAGVEGSTPNQTGVYGFVTGNSTGGAGMIGFAPNGVGVFGETNGGGYGVEGYATNGVGLYGSASSGIGLLGKAGTGDGIDADTMSGVALRATASTSGYGLVAYSSGNVAVFGSNSSGNGGDLRGSYIGVIGRSPTGAKAFPIVATDNNGNDLMFVNGNGDLYYHGGLFNFARTGGGGTAVTFTAKSALPTVEDTGTAQLVGGAASVRLDPTFAATVDPSASYRVFVTPNGDTRGLFVATKTPAGFIVRESQGGRSTVSFDYRIVATALGQTSQRMALTNGVIGPQAPLPLVPAAQAQPAPIKPIVMP